VNKWLFSWVWRPGSDLKGITSKSQKTNQTDGRSTRTVEDADESEGEDEIEMGAQPARRQQKKCKKRAASA
jgi:hypothetical protein